jgi:uncharacterized membrane protein
MRAYCTLLSRQTHSRSMTQRYEFCTLEHSLYRSVLTDWLMIHFIIIHYHDYSHPCMHWLVVIATCYLIKLYSLANACKGCCGAMPFAIMLW